jgi:hypothetical protein
MPFFVRRFDWWLFPEANSYTRATLLGLSILAILFVCEIGFCQWLFAWHSNSG